MAEPTAANTPTAAGVTIHCDCHLLAYRDLTGAIYWLLRYYSGLRGECDFRERDEGASAWLTKHGYAPSSVKARRLLTRKRVPR